MSGDQAYEPGDVVVLEIGEIRLADGRIIPHGAVIEFPSDPPALPISVVWDAEPMRLTRKTVNT